MMKELQNLITTLRDELQQYGGMLALLDQQQDNAQPRGPEEILLSASIVDAQSATLLSTRRHRQRCQRQLAQALNLSSEASLGSLVSLLPEQYRPLISALVQENNDLLGRIRQRARQNQLWLQRSAEVMQRFIATLAPQPSSTMVGEGELELRIGPAGPPLCEAIA